MWDVIWREAFWDEWIGSMDGRPTMWIKHLFCRAGRHVDLHMFVAADDADCFHTHPGRAFRLVVWGGYVEELEGGRRKTWRPGMFGMVRPELSHRIAEIRNGRFSISLWIRGRKTHRIHLRGAGWQNMRQDYRKDGTVLDGEAA